MAQGRIEDAVKLPLEGTNFRAYSPLAAGLGRTHVHEQVAAVLVRSFATLQREQPNLQFVYGETGKKHGGPMPPHRTHQNGLSVDLFVPVRDAAGRSVPLPTPVTLRFGYDIEFDAQGRWQDYRIDFDAFALWLRALRAAGLELKAPIALGGPSVSRVVEQSAVRESPQELHPCTRPTFFASPKKVGQERRPRCLRPRLRRGFPAVREERAQAQNSLRSLRSLRSNSCPKSEHKARWRARARSSVLLGLA